MANEVETLIFKAQTSDLVKAKKDLNKLEKAANDAGDATDEGGKKQKTFGAILAQNKGKILAVTAAFGAMGIAINRGLQAVEDAGANFSILNARLVTATGSTANAAQAFKELNAFALETPFTLEESVNGFAKLVNLGLNPSRESMVSFANTSAAMGTSLEQMIEAVADATTFEFERLKEFGIKTKQETDKVIFSFRGTTTEVEKNATAVKEFLEEIGTNTFAGAAIEQTKTLAGSVSNLDQKFGLLAIAAGEVAGANDIFTKSNNDLADTISDPEFQEGIAILTAKFASLKTAVTQAAAGAVSATVDLLTTTETEAEEKRIKATENLINKFQFQVDTGNTRLARTRERLAEATTEKEIEQLKNREQNNIAFINKFQAKIDALKKQDPLVITPVISDEQTGTGIGQGDDKQTPEEEKIEKKKKILQQFEEFKQELRGTELERMKENFLQQQELENEFSEQQQQSFIEKELALSDLRNQSVLSTITGETDMFKKMKKLKKAGVKAEDLHQKEKNKIILGMGAQLAAGLAGQSKSNFELFKKVRIAEAIISGRKSILNSYEEGTEIGGPPVGAAFAAVAAAATLQHIQAIRSQQFEGGGSVSSGGGGGGSVSVSSRSPTTGVQAVDSLNNRNIIDNQNSEPTVTPEPRVINITVNDSIDPDGARRIIEAINDAAEDGLEINAMVS